MHTLIDRRRFLACASGAAIASPIAAMGAAEASPPSAPGPGPTKPYLLSQDPEVARQVVGASHRDLDMVKSLVDRQPALANASTDWGFGDWETAIDAASHVGRKEIVAYLIERGARPTIFTMVMMGNMDAVRAMVAMYPGIQRMRGPHGLTMLHHARAGGDENSAMVEYLTAFGDADPVYGALLTPEGAGPYLGVYMFGPHETDRIEVVQEKDRVGIRRVGTPNRLNMFAVDPALLHTFHPPGAPSVRMTFTVVDGVATTLTLADPDVYLTATRV